MRAGPARALLPRAGRSGQRAAARRRVERRRLRQQRRAPCDRQRPLDERASRSATTPACGRSAFAPSSVGRGWRPERAPQRAPVRQNLRACLRSGRVSRSGARRSRAPARRRARDAGTRARAHGRALRRRNAPLPDAAALDAGAHVQRVNDAPAEHVMRDRRRVDEEASRRPRNLGLGRGDLAEEKTEARAGGTKSSRRCQREVELKLVWEQEHPVDGRVALEIDEL